MAESLFRFDDFCLDVDRAELRRGDQVVSMEPQIFDLLLFLLRNRARVVSKDELLASVWKGRIVAESTLTSRITTLRQAIDDDGRRQRLVLTVQRKGYRFAGSVRTSPADAIAPAAHTETVRCAAALMPMYAARIDLRRRPLLTILPFRNLSADCSLDPFAAGVVEDLALALARCAWLRVMRATTSWSTVPGAPVWIARNAAARYVLEGSVRRATDAARVTVRLVDADAGSQLWAACVDVAQEDTLALQDRVTAGIVGALGPTLEQVEVERISREPVGAADSYELYLHGISHVFQWNKAGINDALALFERALQLDPTFSPAAAMAAYCYVQRKSYGWFDDRDADIAACERFALQAARTAKDDAVALARAAHALASVVGDIDGGMALVERARRHNRNLALASYVSGWLELFLGRPNSASEHLTTALRLSPFDPLAFKIHAAAAYAHFFNGCYDNACLSARQALRFRPDYLTAIRGAAAAHAYAGRTREARRLMRRMRSLDEGLRGSDLKRLIPFQRSADLERWAEGLHKAGLPD